MQGGQKPGLNSMRSAQGPECWWHIPKKLRRKKKNPWSFPSHNHSYNKSNNEGRRWKIRDLSTSTFHSFTQWFILQSYWKTKPGALCWACHEQRNIHDFSSRVGKVQWGLVCRALKKQLTNNRENMSYSSDSMPPKRKCWGICCRSEEMISEIWKVN